MPRVRVIFSRKNSEKGMSIFHKNSGKGYNICKKFQIRSVILMTQMTNQKKTESIDFFDLVWTKKSTTFRKFFENGSHFFPKTALNIVLWGPPLGTKIPKKVNFFVKNSRKGRYRDFIVAHPCPKIS